MVVVLAVDSDAKGSVALLDCLQWTLDVYPLPNVYKILLSGKKRLHLDFPALAATMADLTWNVDVVWIEDQWSRPSQDIGAMFTFGQGFGDIRTAVAAGLLKCGHDLEKVRSIVHFVSGADWKFAMGLSKDKAHTRMIASQAFPDCKHAWKLVSKHTSAAEAALIALYGASQMGIKIPRGTNIRPYDGPERTTHVRSLTRLET